MNQLIEIINTLGEDTTTLDIIKELKRLNPRLHRQVVIRSLVKEVQNGTISPVFDECGRFCKWRVNSK